MAIIVGVQMAVARAEKHKLRSDLVYTAASVAILVALLGAKLVDWAIRGGSLTLRNLTSGGTFLGGFLLALLATFLLARAGNISPLRLGDAFAASLALGVVMVRLGCFAASCDYGKPTNLPWGVVFTDPLAAHFTNVPLGVRLHPSQLYESALGLLILGVLLLLERKPRRPGLLVFTFALLYSVGRFLLEFLRGDVDRGFWGSLSTSQWLSLATLLVFLALYLHPMRRAQA